MTIESSLSSQNQQPVPSMHERLQSTHEYLRVTTPSLAELSAARSLCNETTLADPSELTAADHSLTDQIWEKTDLKYWKLSRFGRPYHEAITQAGTARELSRRGKSDYAEFWKETSAERLAKGLSPSEVFRRFQQRSRNRIELDEAYKSGQTLAQTTPAVIPMQAVVAVPTRQPEVNAIAHKDLNPQPVSVPIEGKTENIETQPMSRRRHFSRLLAGIAVGASAKAAEWSTHIKESLSQRESFTPASTIAADSARREANGRVFQKMGVPTTVIASAVPTFFSSREPLMTKNTIASDRRSAKSKTNRVIAGVAGISLVLFGVANLPKASGDTESELATSRGPVVTATQAPSTPAPNTPDQMPSEENEKPAPAKPTPKHNKTADPKPVRSKAAALNFRGDSVSLDVERYLLSHGDKRIVGDELHDKTAQTLRFNDMTWKDARTKPVGFKYKIPVGS